MGLITITWQNVYDFLRCPKILAFKTAGLCVREKTQTRACQGRSVNPVNLGTLGEIVAEELLPPLTSQGADLQLAERVLDSIGEPSIDDEPSFSELLIGGLAEKMRKILFRRRPDLKEKLLERVRSLRVDLDGALKSIFDQVVAGIQLVAAIIRERYGEMEFIGHAEAKTPTLPSFLRPDLVFKVKNTETLLLIEVKNKKRLNAQDRFQAAFYASLGSIGGIAIREHRTLGEGYSLAPKSFLKPHSGCVLINVRTGTVEETSPEVDVLPMLEKIWEAKHLGLLGKQPEAAPSDYCRRCLWKKHCEHFTRSGPPTASLDTVAKPLPLLMAKGLLERNIDLDALWWEEYLWRCVSGLWSRFSPHLRSLQKTIIDGLHDGTLNVIDYLELSRLLSIKRQELRKKVINFVIEHVKPHIQNDKLQDILAGHAIVPFEIVEDVQRMFASEIEPWRRLLEGRYHVRWLQDPRRQISLLRTYATLPTMSEQLVSDAWRVWIRS